MGDLAGRHSSTYDQEARRTRSREHVPIRRQFNSRNNKTDGDKRRGSKEMSFKNLQQQNEAIEAAAYEQAKRNTIAYAYQKYPTLVQCDANNRMLIELVERWAGDEVQPSPALFDSMLDENGKDALSMLAQQPVEHTKEQLR